MVGNDELVGELPRFGIYIYTSQYSQEFLRCFGFNLQECIDYTKFRFNLDAFKARLEFEPGEKVGDTLMRLYGHYETCLGYCIFAKSAEHLAHMRETYDEAYKGMFDLHRDWPYASQFRAWNNGRRNHARASDPKIVKTYDVTLENSVRPIGVEAMNNVHAISKVIRYFDDTIEDGFDKIRLVKVTDPDNMKHTILLS